MSVKLTVNDIYIPCSVLSEAEYFFAKANRGDRLKPLGRPCHDCAVVCGFYAEISDALAAQPEPVRTEASFRWFCHNHPNRACRGNMNALGIDPAVPVGRAVLTAATREG